MMTIHTTRNNARTTQRGFTVIEIMVVVAIVGILAAIAYPSYQEQIAKSRRADAQRALIEAEQYMRRYFSAQDTFAGAVLPAGLAVSPRVAAPAAVMYNIQLSNLTATTFTLTAARAGVMASDRCGNLVVTHTGAKSLTGTAAGVSREDCFKAS